MSQLGPGTNSQFPNCSSANLMMIAMVMIVMSVKNIIRAARTQWEPQDVWAMKSVSTKCPGLWDSIIPHPWHQVLTILELI